MSLCMDISAHGHELIVSTSVARAMSEFACDPVLKC